MLGFRLWLTTVCSMQGIRMSPLSHDPFSFPSEERVGFPPLVPTRIHDHWLRFLCLPTGRTNSTDILWTPRARPVGALCILDCACSLMACNLGFCPLVRLSSRSRSS